MNKKRNIRKDCIDFLEINFNSKQLRNIFIWVYGSPYSLGLCLFEIKANTKLSKNMIKEIMGVEK